MCFATPDFYQMETRISRLIYRAITGDISEEEKSELKDFIGDNEKLSNLVGELTEGKNLDAEYAARKIIDVERPCIDMQRRISTIRKRHMRRRGLAAAAVIAALCLGGWWLVNMYTHGSTLDMSHYQANMSIDSIKPGHAMAVLISDEGQHIELSDKESGAASDELIPVSERRTNESTVTEKLCLNVPRGGEFKIVLEDSTEVWLNSESQLRYPAKFDDNERRVQVSGEIYFSVYTDSLRPFYVESAGQEIRVYGTTFNVKAYPDEKYMYTTLESGIISLRQLSGEGGELVLSPGNQAVYDPEESTVELKVVKTSVITSWHNGRFVFEEQPLGNIMRDLSRWYNFEYEFADPNLEDIVFMGSIPRYGDFKTSLATLEKCGGVKFDIDDKKIIIRKQK